MLYIIGAGGHAAVIREAARLRGRTTCMIGNGPSNGEESVTESTFLQKAAEFLGAGGHIICGIGSIGSTAIRQNAIQKYAEWRDCFDSVIHPSAVVAEGTQIGHGVFVAQGCQIVVGSQIGDHALINTAAIIDHGTIIGEGSHVGPGSILCGAVECGEWVHIGSGTVIIQGCKIADGVVLGAGTVVTRSIVEPYSTWVGSPARRIK